MRKSLFDTTALALLLVPIANRDFWHGAPYSSYGEHTFTVSGNIVEMKTAPPKGHKVTIRTTFGKFRGTATVSIS